jgi:glycosyltransferase involved in cell wall biosynthesis
MRKILVIGSSLKDKGGIVTVIQNILDSTLKEQYKFGMLETYITGSRKEKVTIFLKSIFLLIRTLIFDRPDLLHIHMSYKGSFYRKSLLLLISKLFRMPVIIHVHGSSFKDFYSSLNFITRNYCNFILNLSDKLIVLSKEWNNYFSGFVKEDKIEILYNGVIEVDSFISKNSSVPICLFMGRMGKRKGIYDLLKSIKILKEKGIKAKFLLAGDGEIEQVSKEIIELGIEEYADVLGWVGPKQKKELLIMSDILVLPSYNEGLPMAILEAMSHGLPIISTPVGGIPEAILSGENGFLMEPGDIHQMSIHLEKLILDKGLREQMGIKNQKLIKEQFSLNSLMKSLSDIYMNTINSSKR